MSVRSASRRRAVVLALLLACVIGAAPIHPPPVGGKATPVASVVRFAGASCPFRLPPGLVEGENVRCGYLTVPERHSAPDGPTIRLAVAILKSTASDPDPEPVVLLNGGPGQPADAILGAFVRGHPLSLLPLLDKRDVIVFDQRGTGFSQPALYCPSDVPPTFDPRATPVASLIDAAVAERIMTDLPALAGDCEASLAARGIGLAPFNTGENAADVNDLRAALGYPKIDLLGISYGSYLALEVMRAFPRILGSVVIGSPVPPQADLLSGQLIGFDAALTKIIAACAGDPDCAAANSDLEQDFAAAVARLNKRPLPVTIVDPITGARIEVPVDGQIFISTVYVGLYVGQFLPWVPPLITMTAAGEGAVLERILPVALLFGVGLASGQHLAVLCQDEIPFASEAAARQRVDRAGVRPELADGQGLGTFGYYGACAEFGLPAADPVRAQPVRSDVPTLIVTGAYDPITPPSYGELVAATLSDATLVEFPGAGHDPITTGGACSRGLVDAFLSDPAAALDTSCVASAALDL